ARVTLPGCGPRPVHRIGVALGDTAAIEVKASNIARRLGVVFLCRLAVPRERLAVVLRYALAVFKELPDRNLRRPVARVGSLSIDTHRLGVILSRKRLLAAAQKLGDRRLRLDRRDRYGGR